MHNNFCIFPQHLLYSTRVVMQSRILVTVAKGRYISNMKRDVFKLVHTLHIIGIIPLIRILIYAYLVLHNLPDTTHTHAPTMFNKNTHRRIVMCVVNALI